MSLNKSLKIIGLVAGLAIIAVAAYFIMSRQPALPITDNNQSYYVPELRLRFTNVIGITPVYKKINDNTIDFYSSNEIIEKTETAPSLNGCMSGAFGSVQVMPSEEAAKIMTCDITPLNDGKSMIFCNVQTPCWFELNEDMQFSNGGPGALFYREQRELFQKFLNSAELY